MTYRHGVLIVLAALMMACGGSPSSPSGNSGSGGSGSGGSGGSASGHGTLTAVVDGVAYTGTINAATNRNNVLNIASNNSALTLSVNFAATAAVGTTTITASSPIQMGVIQTNGSTVTGSWIASNIGGSGTLTISSLNATGASGTFSFVAPPAPNSTGGPASKTVTSGVFNATF